MMRVIDGKRYNTETAKKLEHWDNGLGRSDFNNCDEALYRTTKGAYFIHGRGGGLSPWAESCEGGRCTRGGEEIEPLSPESALLWLEGHRLDVPSRDVAPELAGLVVDA